MKRSYFAGANTANGFVSYYGQIFGEIDRIYVIKGGSGTGKSHLMKEVSAAAENKGRNVEYFYCSFDPSSLDGIIIDRNLAIIDGTEPHVYEPKLIGVKENLVDLGAFWNEEKLRGHGKEIKELLTAKKQCFGTAYSCLSAVGTIDSIKRNIADKYISRDRIEADVAKTLSDIKPPKNGESGVRLISSVGMRGRVSFNTFVNIAQKTICVPNAYGLGHLYLSALKKEAERFGIPVTTSYSPLFENRPDSLFLGNSVAVVLSSDLCDEVSGLLHENDKNMLEELCAQEKGFESKAVEYFKKASDIHFDIEDIFISAMDFEKKEQFTRDFIKKII